MKPNDFIEKWCTSVRLMLIGVSPSEAATTKREEAEFLADAQSAIRKAKKDGMRLAAVATSHYDALSSHGYLVSDCVLWKLDLLAEHPRKNPDALKQ